MTTTWHHHKSSWVPAPKAPTHPHRNLHSHHQNRVRGFYIWKRRTEKFSSIVEELRAGILEGAQGIRNPKLMENPEELEHLLPQDFENPTPHYIALVRHKTHESKWHGSDTQGSLTPAKPNAEPIHSSWKPAGTILGPPNTPLDMGQVHTGVTQFPWLHTVLLVRTNNQQRSG